MITLLTPLNYFCVFLSRILLEFLDIMLFAEPTESFEFIELPREPPLEPLRSLCFVSLLLARFATIFDISTGLPATMLPETFLR